MLLRYSFFLGLLGVTNAATIRGLIGHCINDETAPTIPDTGCPPNKPLCVKWNEEEPPLNTEGHKCWNPPCVDNNLDDRIDYGCSSSSPRCLISTSDARNVKANGVGKRCGPAKGTRTTTTPTCTNDEPDPTIPDSNCTSAKPMCVKWSEQEPGPGMPGDECWKPRCVDNNPDNMVDYGCSNNNPRCLISTRDASTVNVNRVGKRCGRATTATTPACTNDEPDPTLPDSNCTATKPMCVKWSEQEPATGMTGDKCWNPHCIDNNPNSMVDYGCSSTKPRCKRGDQDASAVVINGVGYWCGK